MKMSIKPSVSMGGSLLGKQGFQKMRWSVDFEKKQSNTCHHRKALGLLVSQQKIFCIK